MVRDRGTSDGKVVSMTGFASGRGALAPHSWTWELRSVNAKGLDLRLRVPDWISGFEQSARKAMSARLSRGSVNLSLRVNRDTEGGTQTLNPKALNMVLDALAAIERAADARDLSITPPSSTDILGMKGVFDEVETPDDTTALSKALMADLDSLIGNFIAMRETEGAALEAVLTRQLSEVGNLISKAEAVVTAREEDMATNLSANLAKVMDNTDGADADRVAQELAIIAVKSDVTEEIDRLHSHVRAAQDLIEKGGPIGRKLDFLMQEFNREANTLCSKAQYSDLTAIGLDLKAVIDQMREQVQNVE